MKATEVEKVATSVHRLAALTAGGVPLHAAWGYLDDIDESSALQNTGFGWRMCSAALDVAAESGAPVSAVLERIATSLRDVANNIRAIQVALASPKATAKLVSILPVIGLAFGQLAGLNPMGALLGSSLGLGLLTLGTALSTAAWLWSRRIVAGATRHRPASGLDLELTAIALHGGFSVTKARALAVTALERHDIAPGSLDVLDTTLALASAAGVPARGLLLAEAVAARSRERLSGEERAARASVQLVVPLGVCVLPAFAILAVVPLLIAMLQLSLAQLG